MRNEVPTPGAPRTTFYHKITENHKNGIVLVWKTTVSESPEWLEFLPRGLGFGVGSGFIRFNLIKRKKRMRGFHGPSDTAFHRDHGSREMSARRVPKVG